MPNSNYEEIIPAGLVLTGGSSNLAGIATLGQETLNFPVRVGVPNSMGGIGDALQDPAYATSVGLVLWGAKHQGQRVTKTGGFTASVFKLASQLKKLFT
jgi:cell division protein FtsA